MNVLKTVNLLVSFIFIILLLVAGVYLNKLLNKTPEQQRKIVILKSDPACDPNQQACVASINQQTVKLRFKQAVKYLTPFDIEVVTKGFEPSAIEKMNPNDYLLIAGNLVISCLVTALIYEKFKKVKVLIWNYNEKK